MPFDIQSLSVEGLPLLPLALWTRFRAEGLTFSLCLDAKTPDLWRFRFAPQAELQVWTHGGWAWRGAPSRARRLVLPMVEEVKASLYDAGADHLLAFSPVEPVPSGRFGVLRSPKNGRTPVKAVEGR